KSRVFINELLSSSLLNFLLLIAIIANACGLFFPILGSNDANFYAVVAKHIVISGDWIDLTYAGHDWLDKPHFPFWLSAVSYKIFGINAFAYILPGFIFNLIGAYYTYLLSRHFYTHQVGILASLIYLTTLHLMLSSIDVRAEAYLLGEIVPACYYWLIYAEKPNFSCVVKGALFTALAIMTKGVFVLLIIFSGLIGQWIFNRGWHNFSCKKWIIALILTGLFITPELITLYIQFDSHPDKIIFNHQGVSGIKFFFWDSQFGRFFDNGPITSGHTHNIEHYFYFMHTFLWAFLPWSIIFLFALWSIYKDLRLSSDLPKIREQKSRYIYLIATIFPTFVLFSLTSFQLDHYTNIIMPFAAIICANWISNRATRFAVHGVFYCQIILSYVLCILVSILTLLLFNGKLFIIMISLCVLGIALFGVFNNNRPLNKAIVYPVLAISIVFIFLMLVNGRLYLKYDAGYKIAQYLNKEPQLLLVDYKTNYSSLEFHNNDSYIRSDSLNELTQLTKPYYLVIESDEWLNVKSSFPRSMVLNTFPWIRQEKFVLSLFNLGRRINITENLLLIFVADDKVQDLKAKSIYTRSI
ncbi:MAG: glycosyltransferase family 39 protein, partial [Burkholderiales bacterium]|nr:glycosyltransferase family 39 protein [Burkholderiales bacterium]